MDTVLIVDDEEAVRDLMAYVLESEGYAVAKAGDSREAMRLHAENPGGFQLLLTDICMKPYEDGFTLARALRRESPDLKVIFASGFVDHNLLQAELRDSPARFLPKPFTPATLIKCVRAVLAAPVPAPA